MIRRPNSSISLRALRLAVIVVLPAVTLAACGGDDESDSTSSTPAAPATDPVTTDPGPTDAPITSDAADGPVLTIAEFAFSDLTVAAGTEFTITNADGFGHTVTDSGDAFDVSVGGGESETLTVADPGSYSIACRIHPSMKGTITVE